MVNKLTTDAIILNFEEIRGRSVKLWSGLPPEFYNWRPDDKALSCIEMIRHVLEAEHIYHVIINNRGNLNDFISPWENRPYGNLESELEFARPFRMDFIEAIRGFTLEDLNSIKIVRKEKKTRSLGDFLNRCAYHEAVHAGQFLSYLRTLELDRPNIWD
jgi:hypothetical protein